MPIFDEAAAVEAMARGICATMDATSDPDDDITVGGGISEPLWIAYMPDAQAALAALKPFLGGWRTIETEPKKGMYLIANALGQVCPVQHHVDSHHGIIQNMVGLHDWSFGEPATHWQPLPASPDKGGE